MLTRLLLVATLLVAFMFGLGISIVIHEAMAGSITVTTTAEQDAALAEMVKRTQPRPVAAGAPAPTAATPQTLVQGFVDRSLAGQVAQIKRQAACAKVTDASAKQALGCQK